MRPSIFNEENKNKVLSSSQEDEKKTSDSTTLKEKEFLAAMTDFELVRMSAEYAQTPHYQPRKYRNLPEMELRAAFSKCEKKVRELWGGVDPNRRDSLIEEAKNNARMICERESDAEVGSAIRIAQGK